VLLVPDAAVTTDTTGNIAVAFTAVIGQAITFCYDPVATKWYPSIAAVSWAPPGTIGSITANTGIQGRLHYHRRFVHFRWFQCSAARQTERRASVVDLTLSVRQEAVDRSLTNEYPGF
jgi:hypothetical protein